MLGETSRSRAAGEEKAGDCPLTGWRRLRTDVLYIYTTLDHTRRTDTRMTPVAVPQADESTKSAEELKKLQLNDDGEKREAVEEDDDDEDDEDDNAQAGGNGGGFYRTAVVDSG